MNETVHCFQLFESRDHLLQSLDQIAKNLHIPAMIIGGAALSNYAYNRATEDIDLVTTVNDAYKFGDELLKHGFEFVGQSKFRDKSGILINFCPEGIQAGHHKFPKPEKTEPGLHYVSLPRLLAMKIQSKRLKDRGDYAELIKRNKLSKEYIEQQVLPYLTKMDQKWARILYQQAISEKD